MDKSNVVFVVYDPPRSGFPFLSAVFIPGREEPIVTSFSLAAQAEAYNKTIAIEFAKTVK